MPALEIDKDNLIEEVSALLPESFCFNDRYQEFSHSVRGVMSGVLEASEIVIKPFIDKDGAEHEAFMLDCARDFGLSALKPVNLIMARLANYVVTDYEPIIPLDQKGWRDMSGEGLVENARKIGQFMGKVHGMGLIHGDCQLKNIFESSSGEMGLMDLDKGELHMRHSSDFLAGCSRDLSELTTTSDSIVGRENLGEFNRHLSEAYFDEAPLLTL